MASLEQIRNELRHMEDAELLAYGRKYRSMPNSDEMKEASAEYKRRKAQETVKEIQPGPTDPSSEDFARMAAEAPPGAYPWKRYPKD
jgi:metal-dependent amidase/aminoacylase/carboxypeptidase family protein